MIKRCSTVREDACRVKLPGLCINRNGGWLLRNSSLKTGAVALGDIGVRLDFEGSSLGLASPLFARVRIRGVGCDSVLNDVSESVVHGAAVAAMVAVRSGAVDELLLRELLEARPGDGTAGA